MVPIFPNEQLVLEYSGTELTSRIVDIIAPIGRGQRGLVLSPPKAGKTELMKRLARSVLNNYSDVRVIVALIGERPRKSPTAARRRRRRSHQLHLRRSPTATRALRTNSAPPSAW